MNRYLRGFSVICLFVSMGCTITFAKRSPWDIQRLADLSDQLEQFRTLAHLKSEETDQLRKAKALFDESEIESSEISVGYDERGLVARFLDRVLFDSGKAEFRDGAKSILDRVANILNEVSDQPIGIEGHTDNEPIKVSGWENNKELSVVRARSVAEYLTEQHNIDVRRLTVIGYGDERPIESNDTVEGRQKNRRVELIVLPQGAKEGYQAEAQRVSEERYAK